MKILKVTDKSFRKYGKVVDNVDFSGLVEELKKTPIPANVVYEPSVKELEALPVMETISRVTYGEMPIQIGYCNGHNTMLNALEYHRDSEINIAAEDAAPWGNGGGDLCIHAPLCALPCKRKRISGGNRPAKRDKLSVEGKPCKTCRSDRENQRRRPACSRK